MAPDVLMRARVVGLACAVVLGLATIAVGQAAERVDVTAMDGTQLKGELFGSGGPGVVLSPAAVSPRWTTAAEDLAARGFRVLRLELRNGSPDADTAARDIEGGYRYLLGRKIRPVFLIATDATAGGAMRVAASVPVAGVAVLGASPQGSLPRVPFLVVPGDSSNTTESVARWLREHQGK